MKNIKISVSLFFILLLASCSAITKTEYYNPGFLKQVAGNLYDADKMQYAFFSEEGKVLISTKLDPDASGWYTLDEPNYIGDDSAVFRLRGWGNYNNTYLGITILTNVHKTTITYGATTSNVMIPSIIITIQSTRPFAQNVIESLSGQSAGANVIRGKHLVSPAMFAASAIEKWTKTSASGIYNPESTEFQSFKYTNSASAEFKTKMIVITPNFTDGTQKIHTNELLFQSNASPTTTIYTYTDTGNNSSKQIMLGLALDLTSKMPRAQMIYEPTINNGTPTPAEIKELGEKLNNNSRWEYGVLSISEVADGTFIPLGDNVKWTKPDGGKFNPQKEETWSFDTTGNTAQVTIGGMGVVHDEFYILEKSPNSNIYRLLNEDPNVASKYNDYYFGFTKSNDTTANFVLTKSLRSATKLLAEKKGDLYQTYTNITHKDLAFETKKEIDSKWDGKTISGLSAAGVTVVGDAIYVTGGFTNAWNIANIKPWDADGKDKPPVTGNTGTTDVKLEPVNIHTYKITGLTTENPTFEDAKRDLVPAGNLAHMQQGQLVALKSGNSDMLYAYGSGAVVAQNVQKLYTHNISGPAMSWSGKTLDNAPNFERYHASIIGLSNTLYLYGGIYDKDDGPTVKTQQSTTGEAKDDLWKSVDGGSTWIQIKQEDNTTGVEVTKTPRVHARLLTIQNEMYLIGGVGVEKKIKTATTTTPVQTPLNDIWKSTDFGKHWTQINKNQTSTLPKTTNGMLPGASYGSLLFLVGHDRTLYYSTDRGKTWKTNNSFKLTGNHSTTSPNIYGAQLVVYKNYLYLIGGQTNHTCNKTTPPPADSIEKKIYRIKFTIS